MKYAENQGSSPYFTAEELSEIVKVSPQTLRLWRNLQKTPPYIQVGRQTFYPKKDFYKWMENKMCKK